MIRTTAASPRCPLLAVAAAVAVVVMVAPVASGCASVRPYPQQDPMRVDDDRQPFAPQPSTYFSPFAWDALDNTVFRPVANLFAVDPAGEAVNVTALDEVADSSWFTNRIGAAPETVPPEVLAIGPCAGAPPLDPAQPWTVVGGKPDGENPGFFIRGQDGSRYLLKFDGAAQAPRATAADVIVTRIYWAAGFETPCNRIVFFDKDILALDPDAKAERSTGKKEPLTQEMVDAAFTRALRLPDGRYRANASLFLPGRPIGPFSYEGVRDDDLNDVVPHEDRRELRASSVLASWVNHFDSREQNSLDMWVAGDDGRGYVQHHIIDFGDCFGSLWEWDALSRRWGHAYMLDFGDVLADLFTFGLVVRPWDVAAFGASGDVFGYFDVAPFDPEGWVNEYPNPAFSRRSERDAHWMARIVAEFTDAHVRAVVATGALDEALDAELVRILLGRRDVLLRAWLPKRSPLVRPEVRDAGGVSELCLDDLAVATGLATGARRYDGRAWVGLELAEAAAPVRRDARGRACVALPRVPSARAEHATYMIVEITASSPGWPPRPIRAHLYQEGQEAQDGAPSYRLVGLQRPSDPGADLAD